MNLKKRAAGAMLVLCLIIEVRAARPNPASARNDFFNSPRGIVSPTKAFRTCLTMKVFSGMADSVARASGATPSMRQTTGFIERLLCLFGRCRMIREGARAAILSFGARLAEVLTAAEALAARGIAPTVADARFAKPLDRDLILRLARDHEALITIEEGAIGGFGSHVAQLLAEEGIFDRGIKYRSMVLPDVFIDQASPEAMYAVAGMTAAQIEAKVLAALGVAVVGLRA